MKTPVTKKSPVWNSLFPLAAGICLAGLAAAEAPRPNIFVVMVDDQGFAQVDPFITGSHTTTEADPRVTELFAGDPQRLAKAARESMPTLRSIAKEGVRFSDASVPLPVCSPSRAAFITGRYPQRFGVYSNNDVVASGVDRGEHFLSETFHENGYATAIIGKWHLGEYVREPLETDSVDYHRFNRVSMKEADHPLRRGFDRYFGFTASGSNFYNPSSLFEGFEPIEESAYLTDAFTREALSFLENRDGDQPFFLFLSYNAPHIPVYEPAPDEYLSPFDTGNPAADNYYAKLRAVDAGLAQIRSWLKERGEWENTFFVYFSDNGAVADSPHPRNAPLRGFKGQLQQGGVRVPMVWKLPRDPAVEAGSLYSRPVSSMDVLPTALRLSGLPFRAERPLDGKDLLPFLKDEQTGDPHAFLFYAGSHASHWSNKNLPFWEGYQAYLDAADPSLPHPVSEHVERYGPGGLSVRMGDWWLRWDGRSDEFVLHHLDGDVSEGKDVAAASPERVERMKTALRDWLKELPPPTDWERIFWERQRKAVGLETDPGDHITDDAER